MDRVLYLPHINTPFCPVSADPGAGCYCSKFNQLIYLVMCKNSIPYRVGDIVFYMYNFSGSFPVFFEVTGLTKCCIKVRPLKNKYINIGAGFGTFSAVPDTWSGMGNASKLLNVRPDGFAYALLNNHRFALRHWDGVPVSGFSS